ncbi:hypothetical protein GALMADRAFT_816034 [Galerina marginata CBS 339.88]|uniref:Uncharacterized protein n=1 Tax=Galerina marginata (strain CBS 339.88) TaxID=685588 RepID=A0A067TIZ7_GALM3|nr:hypothetical protein GALMADRAFT_816034 [Galerina marginata CBS 339.88]
MKEIWWSSLICFKVDIGLAGPSPFFDLCQNLSVLIWIVPYDRMIGLPRCSLSKPDFNMCRCAQRITIYEAEMAISLFHEHVPLGWTTSTIVFGCGYPYGSEVEWFQSRFRTCRNGTSIRTSKNSWRHSGVGIYLCSCANIPISPELQAAEPTNSKTDRNREWASHIRLSSN